MLAWRLLRLLESDLTAARRSPYILCEHRKFVRFRRGARAQPASRPWLCVCKMGVRLTRRLPHKSSRLRKMSESGSEQRLAQPILAKQQQQQQQVRARTQAACAGARANELRTGAVLRWAPESRTPRAIVVVVVVVAYFLVLQILQKLHLQAICTSTTTTTTMCTRSEHIFCIVLAKLLAGDHRARAD